MLFVGSANLTYNGLKSNKEHTVAVTTLATVKEANQDFEAAWTVASRLVDEEIQERIVNDKLRSQQHVTPELRDSEAATESTIEQKDEILALRRA